MVTVSLSGGLGNQMFQYALGRCLALNYKTNLVLDTSHYLKYSDRRYELSCFTLAEDIRVSNSANYYDFNAASSLVSWLNQFIKKMSSLPKLAAEPGYSHELVGLIGIEGGTVGGFDPSIFSEGGNLYLVGFWQNEKYFLDYADQIKLDFSFKKSATGLNSKFLKKIAVEQSVSLHVRRGDYLNYPHSDAKNLAGDDYYKRAVTLMRTKISNPVFYVFSDDPQWCRENLRIGPNTIIVDHNPPNKGHEDMRLMSACKHNIIANSSFSWWAAWLNQNLDKTVIAPRLWLNDPSIDTSDVVPEGWVRL
jgi:hypothetical protein